MFEQVKHIEIKSPDAFLARRKETLGQYGNMGPADCCIMQYYKEGSFLSKKEEKCLFWFFQGLNVYPHNLSLQMKSWAEREAKQHKEKLVKVVFVVYDMFEKYDAMIEVNLPGSLKIFKTNDNKEILSNDLIDSMYVSSLLRTFYEKNLVWGRYYDPFSTDKPIEEFKSFLHVFVRLIANNKDIFVNEEYDQGAIIRGSHACNLLFQLIRRKRIVHHALDFLTDYLKTNTETFWKTPKLVMLYAQLFTLDSKYYKSLKITALLADRFNNDPLLVMNQARYLLQLNMNKQANKLLQSIKQYNQFEIWVLLADAHINLNKLTDALLCLNYACKLIKTMKSETVSYAPFESLGKIKKMDSAEELEMFPQYLRQIEEPVIFAYKEKVDKKVVLPYTMYHNLQKNQQHVFDRVLKIKLMVDKAKFQTLIQGAFQTVSKVFPHVNFKLGMTQNVQKATEDEESQSQEEEDTTPVPQFLADKQEKQVQQQNKAPARNLSIIPEIESFIENSVFEEKKKPELSHQNKHQHLLHERLMRLLKAVFHLTPLEQADLAENYNTVLPTLNKFRKTLFSNFIYSKMYAIFTTTQNYRSIIVLSAELLNELEQHGVKKVDRLPYWAQEYLLDMVAEKGLKHLNDLIEKLKFYDEAIIDSVKRMSAWKAKGHDY